MCLNHKRTIVGKKQAKMEHQRRLKIINILLEPDDILEHLLLRFVLVRN